MGALISMYAIAKYPAVFGKAGIFSPSFWIAPSMYDYISKSNLRKSKIYFISGESESENMVSDMKKMYNQLLNQGVKKSNLKFITKVDGKHSEWFWHREFPEFYKWLINQ
jgi:predicted alpha/beta superfamily hydrolase